MADNITLNAGSGGATLATDDVAGAHHQLVKIEFDDGVDGATRVSASNPLPVDLRADNLSGSLDVNIAASGLDIMLGSDFSDVFGASSVVSATPALKVEEQGTPTVVVQNVHTEDFDTGGGTDTTPALGIAIPGSGGAVVVSSSN
ncbi:MAG: hypothetical protein ACRDIB_10405, partial [Ardenticatenaceae bacterium]